MKPENEQKLKAILGDPLPELDPIYYEGVKFLIPGSADDEVVPYTFYGYYKGLKDNGAAAELLHQGIELLKAANEKFAATITALKEE